MLLISAKKIPEKICCTIIRFYQLCISPLFPPCCRFYPSCSAYAIEALHKYGFFRGSFLSVKRLLRCHPFCKDGYDPVP